MILKPIVIRIPGLRQLEIDYLKQVPWYPQYVNSFVTENCLNSILTFTYSTGDSVQDVAYDPYEPYEGYMDELFNCLLAFQEDKGTDPKTYEHIRKIIDKNDSMMHLDLCPHYKFISKTAEAYAGVMRDVALKQVDYISNVAKVKGDFVLLELSNIDAI